MKRKKPEIPSFPNQLDKLIHERIRLGIVSALATSEKLSFSDLKAILSTTDGNLSVHARKLEDAGYIDTLKSFENRTPKTEYVLLDKGREALNLYVEQMEEILKMVKSG